MPLALGDFGIGWVYGASLHDFNFDGFLLGLSSPVYGSKRSDYRLRDHPFCVLLARLRGVRSHPPVDLAFIERERWLETACHDLKHKHNTRYREQGLPIGSGVTEAACKSVIKQRLCCSGMKWFECGARMVLSLRTLVLTHERWQQLWAKINQYGFVLPDSI